MTQSPFFRFAALSIFYFFSTIAPSIAEENTAVVAAPRSVEFEWMSIATWQKKHQANVDRAAKGEVDLLFLGDSITEGWFWGENKSIYDKHFGHYRTANFGIGGDQTQHLLWRLQNGESGQLQPKLTVLLIGTNNFGHSHHSPEQVAKGVERVIGEIKTQFKQTKILLLGVYPYDHKATSDSRVRVARTNQLLAQLNDDATVYYYDFGSVFIDDRGNIPKALMTDFLHPSLQGYELIAAKLAPAVNQLMQ